MAGSARHYFTITLVKPTHVYLSGIIMLCTNMFQDGPRDEGDGRRFDCRYQMNSVTGVLPFPGGGRGLRMTVVMLANTNMPSAQPTGSSGRGALRRRLGGVSSGADRLTNGGRFCVLPGLPVQLQYIFPRVLSPSKLLLVEVMVRVGEKLGYMKGNKGDKDGWGGEGTEAVWPYGGTWIV